MQSSTEAQGFELMNCFTRAGDCHLKMQRYTAITIVIVYVCACTFISCMLMLHSWFLAGKNYTIAAECADKGAKPEQASALYVQAAQAYMKSQPKIPDLVVLSYKNAGLILLQKSLHCKKDTNQAHYMSKANVKDQFKIAGRSLSLEFGKRAMDNFNTVCKILDREKREMLNKTVYAEMISALLVKRYTAFIYLIISSVSYCTMY